MSSITQLLKPHVQDLGEFNARRSLPHEDLTTIGPFIFFDHLGPAVFPPNKGVDVRPHPHINLATVTYLFEGALLHQDSLGYVREIRPGAVNWMTAGRGIVHSERSPSGDRKIESILHGIQTWVGLPQEAEEIEPSFAHYSPQDIPNWTDNGVAIALIAGEIKGKKSPVPSLSPIIYLDLSFSPAGKLVLTPDYSERAIYSVTGGIMIDGEELPQHRLAILSPGSTVELSADVQARCVIIGGEPLGKRYKWWNFVSSSPERIEQAKKDWQQGKFAKVPGETEFIPLPDQVRSYTN
ncbi:MAG: pirin family protein [Pleurocapsa sp. MO_226.B13]|nr:pirin family protein [Pleurocapsa sp. MO_226.B13]